SVHRHRCHEVQREARPVEGGVALSGRDPEEQHERQRQRHGVEDAVAQHAQHFITEMGGAVHRVTSMTSTASLFSAVSSMNGLLQAAAAYLDVPHAGERAE